MYLHMLVWLKNVTQIKQDIVRADIPWNDLSLAHLGTDLQKSDKSAFKEAEVVDSNGVKKWKMFHHEDAFPLNQKAYISSVLPALRCRMDVQSTDACSYVSKWHDAFDNDAMNSRKVTPFEAAYRHLRGWRLLVELQNKEDHHAKHQQAGSTKKHQLNMM